jgi:hypothetical protein
VKPNKTAAIQPQQVQSKRNSSYHYKPSKSSVAALLQLLHALLQSKRNSTYHYKPSKSQCKLRNNAEKTGWKAEEQGAPPARATGHALACSMRRSKGSTQTCYSVLADTHTRWCMVAYGRVVAVCTTVRMLAYASVRSRMVAYGRAVAVSLSHKRMLAYALSHTNVCWRMLAVAVSFSHKRMLAYASVCSRMVAYGRVVAVWRCEARHGSVSLSDYRLLQYISPPYTYTPIASLISHIGYAARISPPSYPISATTIDELYEAVSVP